MSFKPLLSLSLILAAIGFCAALTCFACAGTGSSDCAKGRKGTMSTQSCTNISSLINDSDIDNEESYDDSQLQAVCLQLFATDYKPKLFARGCGVVPRSADPCEYVSKYVPIQGCKSCRTNLCNKRQQRNERNPLENNTVV